MRYVVIRDDDTNALTPPEYLDRLYRPFMDHGMPVNLAVVPAVRTNVRMPDGRLEGFLCARTSDAADTAPIYTNPRLLSYLFNNPLYRFAQHGLHHDYFEFDSSDRADIERRFDEGTRILLDAGFPQPRAFVAPYDKFTRTSLAAAAARFDVISTGWFEHRRLPLPWWPRYALKKLAGLPHWRIRGATLLTHPGCLLSCYRAYETMLAEVQRAVQRQQLTVLVTHWWEYFRNGAPDEELIGILHQVANWLAAQQDIRVISFDDIANHPRRYATMSPRRALSTRTTLPDPSPVS